MPDPPLPVRRYVLTLPVAAIAFMGLAIVDERETFLAAWGFGAPAPAPTAAKEASARAEETVRVFNSALERCYAGGSTVPLRGVDVSPDVRRLLETELAHPAAGVASRGLRLMRLSFLQVEPADAGGWSLTTEEAWAGPEPTPAPARLRFRYRLAASGGGLRIEEMTPVMPEPVNGTAAR